MSNKLAITFTAVCAPSPSYYYFYRQSETLIHQVPLPIPSLIYWPLLPPPCSFPPSPLPRMLKHKNYLYIAIRSLDFTISYSVKLPVNICIDFIFMFSVPYILPYLSPLPHRVLRLSRDIHWRYRTLPYPLPPRPCTVIPHSIAPDRELTTAIDCSSRHTHTQWSMISNKATKSGVS